MLNLLCQVLCGGRDSKLFWTISFAGANILSPFVEADGQNTESECLDTYTLSEQEFVVPTAHSSSTCARMCNTSFFLWELNYLCILLLSCGELSKKCYVTKAVCRRYSGICLMQLPIGQSY